MPACSTTLLLAVAFGAPAGTSAGKCCYFDSSDCDREGQWCSKDAKTCSECGGTYTDAASQDVATAGEKAETESKALKENTTLLSEVLPQPLLLASMTGKCCYSDAMDCDNARHYCSRSESQCTECGGAFHASDPAVEKAGRKKETATAARSGDGAAPATELFALPLQLDADAVGAAQPQHADTKKQHEHIPKQYRHWNDFIPKQYRHFMNKQHENSTKASAFLEARENFSVAAPLALPTIAGLVVAGFATAGFFATRFTRRSVAFNSEALG